jgi:4-amino-4-deoxy-L-arabinose transferase-like glycosyltransferase
MSATPLVQAHPRVRLAVGPLALSVILAGGLALRLIAIDSRGLWSDEAWRVWAARLPTAFEVLRVAWAQPPSAPLYWLALHAWIVLFGHSDVAVRLLSVPAAVGALLAIYWLGRIVAGPAVGIGAAALLAVSPLAVEVGQEATMYAWSMLFATLALAAGLAWLRTGRGERRYVALGALLLYTHYMGGLFLGLLLILGWAWGCRPALFGGAPAVRPRRWLAAHAVLGLLWAPWLVAMGIRMAQRWDELSHLEHRADWEQLYGLAVNLSVSASAAATWTTLAVALTVATGGALLGGALLLGRAPGGRLVWLVAGVGSGFPIVIVAVSALTGAWLVQPRFLALVLPALLVVVAAGVVTAWQRAVRPIRLGVGVLLGIWLLTQAAGVSAFYRAPVHGQDGLRDIGAWLTAAVQPGDLVVANHELLPWMVAQYYAGPVHGLPEDADVRNGYGLWPPPQQPAVVRSQWAALAPQTAAARYIWLIYLPFMDPDGWLLQQLGARYHQLDMRVYPFATVYRFAGGAAP